MRPCFAPDLLVAGCCSCLGGNLGGEVAYLLFDAFADDVEREPCHRRALSLQQLLKARGAKVAGFTLYIVGEGIEKKVSDFAAEVAAQAAAAATKK